MKLKSMKIEGLFNTFNYDLHFDTPERYLILTGINGYGKTTILNMISSLAEKDLFYFYTIPFTSLSFVFENENTLLITSEKNNTGVGDLHIDGGKRLSFSWKNAKALEIGSFVIDDYVIKKILENPMLLRRTVLNSGLRNYESKAFYQRTKDAGLLEAIMNVTGKNADQLLMQLDSFHATYLQAERTVECRYLRPKDMVPNLEYREPKWYIIDHLETEFKSLLHDEYMNYVKNAQHVDAKFIDKAISTDIVYDNEQYDIAAEKLRARMVNLERMGLIPLSDIKPFDAANAKMLTAYLMTQNEKLDYYNPLLDKITLFKSLIAERGFINKEMLVTQKDGFRFRVEGNGFISLDSLSSGEQNEVVMLYTLVFKVQNDTMLLIDEPENSLHVLWQKRIMKSIEMIANIKNLLVVIATHSPQIIGSRWENTYDLTEAIGEDGE